MDKNITRRNISFSPPDITELEIEEVCAALRSGWITTGPRTKLLERRLAAYIEAGRTDIDADLEQGIRQRVTRTILCRTEYALHIGGGVQPKAQCCCISFSAIQEPRFYCV